MFENKVKSGAEFMFRSTRETSRAGDIMKNGAIDKFLAAVIFSGVFTLMTMAGAMGYAIFTGIDNGKEITRAADSGTAKDEFNPDGLPAPAAGVPVGNETITYNCKDMIYQTSNSGINYVREYGGVYNAAVVNNRFSLYMLDYGYMQPVNINMLEPDSLRKLRYALESCNENYIRSGTKFLVSVTPFGSSV